VVLFADRSLEPKELTPYQPLLDAGLIQRFYLEEMPEVANAPLGLSILYLIRQTESQATVTARTLVARTKAEIGDEPSRADLIQLIETIIMYKLPRLSRKEIHTMLEIHDIRESRAYQETLEEGEKKGMKTGAAIVRLAAKNKSDVEIAAMLKVDIEQVRQVLAQAEHD
jgi:predicted transposase/invertase (TIGR01784 family)